MTPTGAPQPQSDRYSVSPPSGVCAATALPIAPGETLVAVLVQDAPDAPLRRVDYSASAWDAGARPTSGEVFASWRSPMPSPDAPKRRLVGDDQLMDVFEQLDDGAAGRAGVFRYLLALMLVRRRRLSLEGGAGGTLRVRQVLPGGKDAQSGARVFHVRDPVLDEATIAQATEELAVLMAHPAKAQP